MTVTKTIIGGSAPGEDCRAATNYIQFATGANSSANAGTTEANRQSAFGDAGTLDLFSVTAATHSSDAGGCTVRLRKNTANGNQLVSIPSNTLGQYQDAVNTDTVASADLLDFSVVLSSLAHFTIGAWAMRFVGTSVPATMLSGAPSGGMTTASSTSFMPISGGVTVSAGTYKTEANVQHKVRAPGTFSLFGAKLSANGNANTLTYKFRKNTADGNQVISWAAGATTYVSDAVNTDAVLTGDLIAISVTTGASTVSYTPQVTAVTFKPSGSPFDMMGSDGDAITVSIAADQFFSLNGRFQPDVTESIRQQILPLAFTGSKLRAFVTVNTAGSAATVKTRVGGADGNQSISITASTAGWFEDAVNTDSFTVGAAVNGKIVHPTSGTLKILTVMETADPGGGSVNATGNAAIGTVNMTAPAATGEAGEKASGDIGTVTMSAPAASGEAGSLAQGSIGTITMDAPLVGGEADEVASGNIGTITMHAPIADAGAGHARTTQVVRITAGDGSPDARTTQVTRLVVAGVSVMARTTQVVRLIVASAIPCATKWCQAWRIKRRDGLVLRFTSLDEDLLWGTETFESCGSLDPSASESASTMGQVGNIELDGIISSDRITEADLYGGLYDDAFVEVWLVPYETDVGETPKRLAAGWTGNLSHTSVGFKMEVTGPGARIDQQALTQPVTATCRWIFGSLECTKDIEALKQTGVVTGAINRGQFFADLTPGAAAGIQWANGTVRWTSGENDAVECEVKDVDFDSGLVTLWALPGFIAKDGDTFDLLPGCDLSADTCKGVYNNLLNFGGYKDVPGNDAIAQTPNQKY